MTLASAQVVAHRTSRLASATFPPSARDRQEFALMGREKADAASESAQAVGMQMLKMNQHYAAVAFKNLLAASAALMSIATSRSVAESISRQSKFARLTMSRSICAASGMSDSAAHLARKAQKPVHTRVSGNVRRLRLKSR